MNLKKIIKETIDEFEWVKEIGDYDIEGFYVTEPVVRDTPRGLMSFGNLYFIKLINKDEVEVYTTNVGPSIQDDFMNLAKHELLHFKSMLDKKQSYSSTPVVVDGPYRWGLESLIDYIKSGYFIKLS